MIPSEIPDVAVADSSPNRVFLPSRIPYCYSSAPHEGQHRSYFIVSGDPASPPSLVNVSFCYKIDGLKKTINEERLRDFVSNMLWKLNVRYILS
jgi:hypothetical protein